MSKAVHEIRINRGLAIWLLIVSFIFTVLSIFMIILSNIVGPEALLRTYPIGKSGVFIVFGLFALFFLTISAVLIAWYVRGWAIRFNDNNLELNRFPWAKSRIPYTDINQIELVEKPSIKGMLPVHRIRIQHRQELKPLRSSAAWIGLSQLTLDELEDIFRRRLSEFPISIETTAI